MEALQALLLSFVFTTVLVNLIIFFVDFNFFRMLWLVNKAVKKGDVKIKFVTRMNRYEISEMVPVLHVNHKDREWEVEMRSIALEEETVKLSRIANSSHFMYSCGLPFEIKDRTLLYSNPRERLFVIAYPVDKIYRTLEKPIKERLKLVEDMYAI